MMAKQKPLEREPEESTEATMIPGRAVERGTLSEEEMFLMLEASDLTEASEEFID